MVLVFVEGDREGLSDVSLETLTFARSLLGAEPLHAVLVGAMPEAARQQLAEQGVSVVYVAVHEAYSSYAAAAVAAGVVAAQRECGADVLVGPGSPRGNEVLAHVAARLDAPMAANAVGVQSISPLEVTRQVMGGSVLEDLAFQGPVAIVSVAGHACEARAAEAPGAAQERPVTPEIQAADVAARLARLEVVDTEDASRLAKARVVVGAGRGAGGPDGFDGVVELAEVLGGVVGVSRVVTSLGWRPHHEQVGQTGTRISPELYIPCGISGAIQHWAGCSSAQTILAVNTDPDAPMVTRAQYAVIGDMHEVVPAIVAELRKA